MRRIIYLCLLCVLVLITDTYAALIYPGTDLTYLGSFRISPDRSGSMTYWPGGNSGAGSLIVVDGYDGTVTEYSIPAQGTWLDATSTAYASLPAGSVVQAETDPTNPPGDEVCNQGLAACCTALDTPYDCCTGDGTGCTAGSTSPRITGIAYMAQQAGQTEDKLYYVLKNYYSPIPEEPTLGWSNLDFASGVTAAGNWSITDVNPTGVGQYVFAVDPTWADSYGSSRYLGVGRFRIWDPGSSYGPSFYMVDPWTICGGEPIDCENSPPAHGTALTATTKLLYNANPSSQAYYADRLFDSIGRADSLNAATWIKYGTKEALAFVFSKSDRPIYFDVTKDQVTYGFSGPDDSNPNKGYQGQPYYGAVAFLDPADLQSPTNPWDPQPYSWFQAIPIQYLTTGPDHEYYAQQTFTGVAFDSVNGRLFIMEANASGGLVSQYPAIHVWQVGTEASSKDETVPTAPSNLVLSDVSTSSATVSWTAGTDANGGVAYRIKVNGTPMFATDAVSITHTNLAYYVAPVTYNIVAWDKEKNESSAAAVSVAYVNGGNSPLCFFVSSNYSSSTKAYYISQFPQAKIGDAYSFTPKLESDEASHTWTLVSGSLPTGLSLNSSTGEISGTPSGTSGTLYPFVLQVQNDSDSSIYRRKSSISIGTTPTDADNDGTATALDVDDHDCNNPTAPSSFSAPAVAQIIGNTLSWTMGTDARLVAYKVYSGDSTGNLPNTHFIGYTNSVDISSYGDSFFAVVAMTDKGYESAKSDEVAYLASSSSTGFTMTGGQLQ